MVGTAQDITERVRAEEARVIQREQQARLAGMLFVAHELASRVDNQLAQSAGAINVLQPEATLAPHLREAVNAAAKALSEATRAITEL